MVVWLVDGAVAKMPHTLAEIFTHAHLVDFKLQQLGRARIAWSHHVRRKLGPISVASAGESWCETTAL